MSDTKRKLAEIMESGKPDTIKALDEAVSLIYNSLDDDYVLKIKQEGKGVEKVTTLYFTALGFTYGCITNTEYQLCSIKHKTMTNLNQYSFELWLKNGCHFESVGYVGGFKLQLDTHSGLQLILHRKAIFNLSLNQKLKLTKDECRNLYDYIGICRLTNQIIQE